MNSIELMDQVLTEAARARVRHGRPDPRVYTVDDNGHLIAVTGVKIQVMRDSEGDTVIMVIEREERR